MTQDENERLALQDPRRVAIEDLRRALRVYAELFRSGNPNAGFSTEVAPDLEARVEFLLKSAGSRGTQG